MDVTRERLLALPKAELHVHLDGSLRPETLVELARATARPLPTYDPEAYRALMAETTTDLEGYLARFGWTVSVMQSAETIERIAFELAEDAARENVRWLEVRFCPALNTREGLTAAGAVEASLRGLARAEAVHPIRTAVIVCALRNLDPATSVELAEMAVGFKGRGVVAFDLAGGEWGRPASAHREAFAIATRANLAVTVHAGEAFGPPSIAQALHDCGAHRIGHGTRLHEDPDLQRYVRDFRIPLEVCLTSNLQTGAVRALAEHPLRGYYNDELVVTLSTDNRLVSATTLTDEYLVAHRELGFGWEELVDVALMGFEAAFMPWGEKQALLAEVAEDIRRMEG